MSEVEQEFVLAVDTSGNRCIVVCGNEHKLIYSNEADGSSHLEWIGVFTQEALLRLRELSGRVTALAVVTGPGGFSGLRIGVSFISVLAQTLAVKVLPLSSLYVRAMTASPMAKRVLVVNDAKRAEVFYGYYEKRNGELVERASGNCKPSEVLDKLQESDLELYEVQVVGDALGRYSGELSLPQNSDLINPTYDLDAFGHLLIEASMRSQLIDGGVDPKEVRVNYIRGADARANFKALTNTSEKRMLDEK